MHRKALYNLLRLNWKEDPSLGVDLWQIEDYRMLNDQELFDRLCSFSIRLDSTSFLHYVEGCESPEDLIDCFADELASPIYHDQAYLLIFEIWRRFASHKRTLSIFCDELDHCIESYDRGFESTGIPMENALVQLEQLLTQNIDAGACPKAVFYSVCERCASDIESFLYDYVCDQIEHTNISYAVELLRAFAPYLPDSPWFALLQARLAILTDEGDLETLTRVLFTDFSDDYDIELGFEVLDFIIQTEQFSYFLPLLKQLFMLAEFEQDFRDLLFEFIEYLKDHPHLNADDDVQDIIDRRKSLEPDLHLEHDDPDLKEAVDILHRLVL